MKKFAILMILAGCVQPALDEPTQASEQSIARFVADVSPELTPEQQAAASNCGAQNTTSEELQRLSAVGEVLDAATTGLISEIMTRDGTLACLELNGVPL